MRRMVAASNVDILVFNAPMERPRDQRIITWLTGRECRPNLFMIVVTNGGDPHVAYRIGRAIQKHYTKVTICVSGTCKSAGTLLVLGAHEVAFSEHGDIGPLDIQMAQKDELWEFESGLTVMTALSALYENAQDAFDHFLLSLTTRSSGRITTRTAADIAAKLTEALYSRISEQIDPIHMGEVSRSMAIAKEYGKRLTDKSKNLKDGALETLISGYPSHSFVIDIEEAKTLFRNARECNVDELALLEDLDSFALTPSSRPWVRFLSDDILEEDEENAATTAGSTTVLEQPGTAEPPPPPDGSVPSTGGESGTASAGG
jgi:hypothetical protein